MRNIWKLLAVLVLSGGLCACDKEKGVQTPSNMIGPEGGTASFDGITLTIPEGALDSPLDITASFPSDVFKADRSMPMLSVGNPFELGPDGTQFNVPVKVTVDTKDWETKGGSTLGVFCYNETDDCWNLVGDANVTAGRATFETTHFSLYAFSYLESLDMDRFEEYARLAVDSGLSDQSIIDRFLDYFLGEKYVMEAYRTFALGRYYKPFFCLVSGAYIYKGKQSNDLVASYGKIREGFKGWCDTASGHTSWETFKKARDGKITEKTEMFYSLIGLDYEMVTPTMEISADAPISAKGETATVTVKLYVTDEFNGWKYPCEGQEIKVGTSDEGQVDISETVVTTDANGEATFIITAKRDDPNATIRTTYSYNDDFDSVFTQKTLEISNDAETWHVTAQLKYDNASSFYTGQEIVCNFSYDAEFTFVDEYEHYFSGHPMGAGVDGKISISCSGSAVGGRVDYNYFWIQTSFENVRSHNYTDIPVYVTREPFTNNDAVAFFPGGSPKPEEYPLLTFIYNSETSTGDNNSDDGYVLPPSLYFSLVEGTYALVPLDVEGTEDEGAAFFAQTGELFYVNYASDTTGSLDNCCSGTITITKVKPQNKGR